MSEQVDKPRKKRSSNAKRKFPKGAVRKGYSNASPAVCIVVHDLGGMPMNDRVAQEISDAVTEKAVKYGYVVNWTRQ